MLVAGATGVRGAGTESAAHASSETAPSSTPVDHAPARRMNERRMFLYYNTPRTGARARLKSGIFPGFHLRRRVPTRCMRIRVPVLRGRTSIREGKMTMKTQQREELLQTLQTRFEKYPDRHKGISWADVLTRLNTRPDKLRSLGEMEATGGEPDVVGRDKKGGEVVFMDCAPESPAGRRSVCFDRAALDSRKENKPRDCAGGMAEAMGAELLTEAEYRDLQRLGHFDTKTSSWVQTPADIRKLGGALFCDRRYGQVFVYHNGAESYYASRGFRSSLRV